jgi:hypothetical protein
MVNAPTGRSGILQNLSFLAQGPYVSLVSSHSRWFLRLVMLHSSAQHPRYKDHSPSAGCQQAASPRLSKAWPSKRRARAHLLCKIRPCSAGSVRVRSLVHDRSWLHANVVSVSRNNWILGRAGPCGIRDSPHARKVCIPAILWCSYSRLVFSPIRRYIISLR